MTTGHRLLLVLVLALPTACAASKAAREPAWRPAAALAEAAPPPAEDLFARDRGPGGLSEEQLRALLDAPVYLAERARVGVLPVGTGYDADESVPLTRVPGEVAAALEETGHFALVSEIATDWPATSSIAGLRELAARYRCDYLLLYRHRFVERDHTNGWAWTWPTIVGLFAAPASTVESAGVLEATMFDVATGTILFSEFERVKGSGTARPFTGERRQRELKESLLGGATKAFTTKLVGKVQRLVAERPSAGQPKVAAGPDA